MNLATRCFSSLRKQLRKYIQVWLNNFVYYILHVYNVQYVSCKAMNMLNDKILGRNNTESNITHASFCISLFGLIHCKIILGCKIRLHLQAYFLSQTTTIYFPLQTDRIQYYAYINLWCTLYYLSVSSSKLATWSHSKLLGYVC